MAWRNFDTHREETKAVKAALNAAGINCVVKHRTGTAWGWLEINIGKDADAELRKKTLDIALEATGRHGDYNGEILILTQDHWDQERGQSIPIIQPYIKPEAKEQKAENITQK
ncbi:MAG: hypothetical protein WC440_00610 [Candidatus Omnitrophota bacterium]